MFIADLLPNIIFETIVHRVTVSGITIHVDDHYIERARERNITHKEAGRVLAKLPKIKDKLAEIDPGQQIWVLDPASGISLGMRKQMDQQGGMNFVFKTIVRDRTYDTGDKIVISL